MLTFSAWLKTKRGEDSPLGDLASDAASDRKWPVNGTTLDEFQRRLAVSGACPEARNTLDAAWREYERSQGLSARSLRRSRREVAA
jgi:uncharacterized protein YozE (UPF0346 family)